jgi:hypothetical protein
MSFRCRWVFPGEEKRLLDLLWSVSQKDNISLWSLSIILRLLGATYQVDLLWARVGLQNYNIQMVIGSTCLLRDGFWAWVFVKYRSVAPGTV